MSVCAGPGSAVQIAGPGGGMFQVSVPAGCGQGQTFHVQVPSTPPAQMAAPMQQPMMQQQPMMMQQPQPQVVHVHHQQQPVYGGYGYGGGSGIGLGLGGGLLMGAMMFD